MVKTCGRVLILSEKNLRKFSHSEGEIAEEVQIGGFKIEKSVLEQFELFAMISDKNLFLATLTAF